MIELEENCCKFIEVIDLLLPKAKDDQSKVFYYKLKGDYYRRMAEAEEGNLKKVATEGAKKSYDNALQYIKTLKIIDPIRLGLFLNLSVYYYEILENHQKQLKLVEIL